MVAVINNHYPYMREFTIGKSIVNAKAFVKQGNTFKPLTGYIKGQNITQINNISIVIGGI